MAYRLHQFQEASHQPRNVSEIALRFLHIERLAEAEITEDIEYEVIRLIGHVQWLCPLTLLRCMLFDQVQPSVDIGVDQRYSSTQSTVRESLV
jgi:hypothetical protein